MKLWIIKWDVKLLLVLKMTHKKVVCGIKNFSLLFDAIGFEKYLGYAICQACCW